MKAAFVIGRNTHYRLMGPIIDRALEQGWQVECWLNYGSPREGVKAYQFPDRNTAPTFAHGQPEFRAFHTDEEMRAWATATNADGLLSMTPLNVPRISMAVQHAIDFFISHTPDEILSCSAVALYSDWWRVWMLDYFGSQRLVEDREGFARRFASRAVITGFPSLDSVSRIDPDEVRDRWSIPRGRPVVLLLPFGQGAGKASFWPRNIFGEPRRLKQLVNVAAQGRLDYLAQVPFAVRDLDVVRAVRRFCDRHGAFLLVKSREKTPIPAYTAALADKCVYDDSYYPPTVLEALSISDLCVSYYSATVTEAAPLGVPHLCITFDGDEYCGGNAFMRGYFDRFFNRDEGGVFQFEGVTRTVSIPDALDLLNRATLDDVRMDPAARGRYVLKFLGYDDFNASNRILHALTDAIGRETVSARARG